MASISNLYIDQGTDFSTIVTVGSTSGLPFNLTGFTVASQIRKSYQSSMAYNFTSTVTDAANGKIRLALAPAVNETMTPGRWLYDVEVTETATGKKTRVVEGIILLNPQITKI